MELLPINETIGDNDEFVGNPVCLEILRMTVDYYKKIGFEKPWIGYFAKIGDDLVGSAGFKGKPVNGSVEIAYGTFEQFQKQGVGTKICRLLVELSLKTDPSVRITARTLPEKNFSTRVLEKNNFVFNGPVTDPDDGEVWEWVFATSPDR